MRSVLREAGKDLARTVFKGRGIFFTLGKSASLFFLLAKKVLDLAVKDSPFLPDLLRAVHGEITADKDGGGRAPGAALCHFPWRVREFCILMD